MKAKKLGKINMKIKTYRKVSKKLIQKKKFIVIVKDVQSKEVNMICKTIKYKS